MAAVRTGIVGAGVLSERLLPHFLMGDHSQFADVVALADPNLERAEMLAGQHDVADVFADLDSMLARADLDALLVATPIQFHADHVRAGLEAGLHVHTQKTLATNAAEARALVELAGANGLVLAASPGQMLLPAFKRAGELIEQGVIGLPFAAIAVNSYYGHEVEVEREGTHAPDPTWYYRAGGGPLADMGIYSIHAMIGLLGRPSEVVSFATRPLAERYWRDTAVRVEVEDNVQVLLRFPNDVLASLTTSYSGEPTVLRWGHLALTGSEGAIEVGRNRDFRGYDLHLRTRTGTTSEYYGHGLEAGSEVLPEAHVFLDVLDFMGSIAEGRQPGASASIAVDALAVLDAAASSAATGRVVQIRDGRT